MMETVPMEAAAMDQAVEKLAQRILAYRMECNDIAPINRKLFGSGTWEEAPGNWKELFRYIARRLLEAT